jgi:WD40 repeat protein
MLKKTAGQRGNKPICVTAFCAIFAIALLATSAEEACAKERLVLNVSDLLRQKPTPRAGQIALSPSGQLAACGVAHRAKDVVFVWNTTTGKLQATLDFFGGIPTAGVARICISPDEKVLTTVGTSIDPEEPGSFVHRWDLTSGKKIESFSVPEGGINLALSSDGKYLVTYTRKDPDKPANIANIWNLQTKKKVGSVKLRSFMVVCGAIDKNGKYLVLGGSDGEIIISSFPSGKTIHSIKTEPQVPVDRFNPWPSVDFVDLSADGRLVVSHHQAGPTQQGGLNQLWDATSGKPIGQPFKSSCVESRFTPDNGVLVSSEPGSLVFRSVDKQEVLHTIVSEGKERREMKRMVMSPDGKTVSTASGIDTIHVWTIPQFK